MEGDENNAEVVGDDKEDIKKVEGYLEQLLSLVLKKVFSFLI